MQIIVREYIVTFLKIQKNVTIYVFEVNFKQRKNVIQVSES